MTIIVLMVVVLGFALLERRWAEYALKSLVLHTSWDHTLAEPGKTITQSVTVENHSRLAIPFVRVVLGYPDDAKPASDKNFQKRHYRNNILSWNAEYRLTLRGRRSITKQVAMTFNQRGVYQAGNYHLSAGDLLGFREAKCHGDGKSIVVTPHLSQQKTSLDAVGGFIGDISVKRFILEDPILTTGFRDYTGREPMRTISWTRTAQAGTLQVKQYDYTAERHIVVLLNVEGADEEEFEECLRLTRSVCERLEQQKIPYGFRTNGNLPGPVGKISSMVEGLGEQHLKTILYGLGSADSTCFHSFDYMTRQTLRTRKSSEAYILITPNDQGEVHTCIQELNNAVGAPICVLRGCEGVDAQ